MAEPAGIERRVSPISMVIGTLLPAVFAAFIGAAVAIWMREWQGATKSIQGAICGGGMGIVVGFVMAWHGGAVGGSPARCGNAALWGIIPGGLMGMSLGPVIGGAIGLLFGQLLGGTLIGLLGGGIVGIAAWELAFSSDEIIEMIRRRRALRNGVH